MTYSDENLYKLLLSLPHNLRHSFGRREADFPPNRRPPLTPGDMESFPAPHAGFDPRGQMPPRGPFPDRGRDSLPDGAGFFRSQYPRSPHDRRPPLARERILRLIGESEPVSQTVLASHLAIRPQSLSEQLAKLENDGLILRNADEQDKRVTLVSLTEAGRERAHEVEAARAEQAAAFLSPLSQEEREQLFFLLQKLAARV